MQRDPNLVRHEYDLEKGKNMLADLGYIDRDKDGVIEDNAGKPFRFKLTYASDREDSRLVALLLRDDYAKAGIQMDLDPQLSAILYDMMDKKSFQALTSGWGGGVETDIYIMFHSKEIQNSLYNFISYNSPRLDALIDKAHTTVDEDKRMGLWRQAERVLHEEQPYTFLARRKSLFFVNKRLENVKVEAAGFNLDLVPVKVYVPKALQKH
jgi:peptide/nickel transport system substrate-binding protein